MTTSVLPIDPSGSSPANKITDEIPTVVRGTGPNPRMFVPANVPFYADSMVIVDTSTGKPLADGQWFPTEIADLPTARYQKLLCYAVIINDAGVSDNLSITYQALGDGYPIQSDSFLAQFVQITNNRPDAWPSLYRSAREFSVSDFIANAITSQYGFETVAEAIQQLADRHESGDDKGHDDVWRYAEKTMGVVATAPNASNATLQSHLVNYANPHQVTTDQADTYNKPAVDSRYNALSTLINSHLNDTSNPHADSASALGMYTKPELADATTPSVTTLQQAVATHIARTDNPHADSAAAIGCYTKAQIDTLLGTITTTLGNHPQDTSNPHHDTADNIGTYLKTQFDTLWSKHTQDTSNPHQDSAAALFMYLRPDTDSMLSNKADAANVLSVANFNAMWDQRLLQRMSFVYTTPNTKIYLTIASTTWNYNIYNAARAAGWDGVAAVDVILTVNGGVPVLGSNTSVPAMDTGSGWPIGSTLTLNNSGVVAGAGGNGGDVGWDYIPGHPGGNGGDAIALHWPMKIVNNGSIFGGGGGGGGGGGVYGTPYPGSGGGGQGYNNPPPGNGTGYVGAGGSGSASGPGYGGRPTGRGGWGGAGGGWGSNGAAGAKGAASPGGAGGAGGYAIRLNGYSVNLSVNGVGSPNLKGAVA